MKAKNFGHFTIESKDGSYSNVLINVTHGKYRDFVIAVENIGIETHDAFYEIHINYRVDVMKRLYEVNAMNNFVNECISTYVKDVIEDGVKLPQRITYTS